MLVYYAKVDTEIDWIRSKCFLFISGFSNGWFDWLGTPSLIKIPRCLILLHFLYRLNPQLIGHELSNLLLENIQRPTLIHRTLYSLLLLCPFNNPVLNCILGHQLIDVDVPSLADSVGSVGSLSVHCGVPVVVVEDDVVSCG